MTNAQLAHTTATPKQRVQMSTAVLSAHVLMVIPATDHTAKVSESFCVCVTTCVHELL